MYLSLNDFTYLERKDGELVFKDLAAVDSHSNRVSSCVKRPKSWEELSFFNVRMNEAIDRRCNWNDFYVPYSGLETMLHREKSSAGEISPTRCNNCVFYSQWLFSTCFG